MEKYIKNGIVVGILVLIAVAGFGLASQARAQENPGRFSSIIQRLADKFGLNQDEVQAVFDEERAAHQAEHEAMFSQRLDDAVSSGQITAEQKQLIIDKRAELESERQAFRDEAASLTPQERRDLMKTKQDELMTWAQENGIDLSLLHRFAFGDHEGMGRGHHFGL